MAVLQETVFESEGYASLPAFLSARELSTIRAHVDAVLAKPLPSGCERPHNVKSAGSAALWWHQD